VSLTAILFVLLAVGAIATGITMITRRNPVTAAMFLVLHFVMLSGLYLTLQAQLLAALQILVYAGAIMVLVLFVIMLLNLGKEEQLTEKFNTRSILSIAFAAVMLLQLASVFLAQPVLHDQMSDKAATIGTVEAIGNTLFSSFIFPFEAISLLLLTAVVGAILLAKKRLDS
jgi:NADH-quinone oxidoreductase subunit J